MYIIMKKRRTNIDTNGIVKLFKSVHGDKYNYKLVNYKTMHHKVKIICSEHGMFEQTPNSHFRRGDGCKKCGHIKNIEFNRDDTNSFILKSINVHGNRYDYSKVEYGKNAHEKVNIICKQHGSFMMTPNSHLSKKSNCPKCSRRKTGWTRTSWKNSCDGKIAKLYFIRCFNENESFFKIGITNKGSISNRFLNKTLMPYQYEIIKVVESENDPISIWELERSLHKIHKKFKYKPKIWFAGSTECFNKILI